MRKRTSIRICLSVAILLLAGSLAPAAAQQAPPSLPQSDAPGLLPEPRAITAALDFAGRFMGDGGGKVKEGFYPTFKGVIPGAGMISAGGGYRRLVLDRHGLVDGSVAVSMRGYKTAQARFELIDLAGGQLLIGSQAWWQDLTQVQYFGIGGDSAHTNRSDYRLKTTDVVAYAKYHPTQWLTVDGRIGRLARPTLSSSTGPFDREYPDAMVTFAGDPGFVLATQPSFLHGELSIAADTRNYPKHPTRGGLYRTTWSEYSDRDLGTFSFRRYQIEAAHFVPLVPDRWTLALRGWTALTDTAGDRQVPAYFLPSLGGPSTLRSFENYRFHDRNLLLVGAESRWALFRHVDAALFVDAGGVAARVRDLGLGHRSYGVGLRVHNGSSTLARFDLAHGREGWRVLFRLDEPFNLRGASRPTAAIPFVP